MMKHLSLLLFLIVNLFLISACNSKINSVKETHWGSEESITLGDALDKYKYFEKTKWKNIKTDNGRKFVEFTGIISPNEFLSGVDEVLNNAKIKFPNIESDLTSPEKLNEAYMEVSIMLTDSYGVTSSQLEPKMYYMVGSNMKKFIDDKGRLKLTIRFKVPKEKSDRPDIESIQLTDTIADSQKIDNLSEHELLSNIYEEKHLFGDSGMNSDPYWKWGATELGQKVGEALKQAQRSMMGVR